MKKYLIIALIAIGGFTISCTTDHEIVPNSNQNLENQELDYVLIQKQGDTISSGDTGGQDGHLPTNP